MKNTPAHCNTCRGERNHEILHSEASEWKEPYETHVVYGGTTVEMLRCSGCEELKLCIRKWNSEEGDEQVTYIPPATIRNTPDWLNSLSFELSEDDSFVETILKEIYIGLENNLPHLSVMGLRSLIERIMISKIGDQGNFQKNLNAFKAKDYVSESQRVRLLTLIEAGNATIHRDFTPTIEDVVTLIDLAEHIVKSVYLQDKKLTDLRSRTPPRSSKNKNH